ncbi:hypothetical protein Tcan_18843, partial [Toxocara canis]
GMQDPLSLRFETAFRDERGIEHRSAERYNWYKMAEHFGDAETMAKILDAPTTIKAEEAMKEIKDFNEAKWNEVFGTGWLKNRDEANKPIYWDGEN